jgi:hypothetical protein
MTRKAMSPKKRANHVRNTHLSHIPDIKISDNDSNMSTSGDFDFMAQARKSCVVIKMGDHIKLQTDHMNGTEVTCQAAF